MILENSKLSQSTGSRSKSSNQSLQSETWNLSGTQGNVFWQSTSIDRFITDTLSRNSSLLESKCYRWKPVQKSTGKPVDGSEEQNRDTIPTPRFAWKLSTLNSFFPAGSQNYMADQQRLQISELHFDKFSIQRLYVGR